MADRFSDVVPNSDVILLERSGHYPHVETPEEVIDAIFNFHDNLKLTKAATTRN